MIATEVRQPTIPRAILRRFTFYSMAKLSGHKVITLTKHWVLNRIAPPSSITIGLIMLYLLPRPWAAISDFRFTFRRGKFSFCAAKSMGDLSLAFRNLHKLHNSRSSVNYLDVAAWTCAWTVLVARAFSSSFFNQRANFWPGPVIAKITGWCKHWHWFLLRSCKGPFERLLELVFWLILLYFFVILDCDHFNHVQGSLALQQELQGKHCCQCCRWSKLMLLVLNDVVGLKCCLWS